MVTCSGWGKKIYTYVYIRQISRGLSPNNKGCIFFFFFPLKGEAPYEYIGYNNHIKAFCSLHHYFLPCWLFSLLVNTLRYSFTLQELHAKSFHRQTRITAGALKPTGAGTSRGRTNEDMTGPSTSCRQRQVMKL